MTTTPGPSTGPPAGTAPGRGVVSSDDTSLLGLPRNVVVLSWVSLVADVSSEMLYPLLPIFLTATLGAAPVAVGAIEGAADATSAALKAASGRWADRRTARRPLVALGYSLSAIGKALVALATGWPLVLLARVTDRFGKGIRTSPRDAIIAGETPAELRGRAFGFHRAADTTGAVIGPLLGLALYELLDHRLRVVFAVAVLPAVVSVALIGLVRERPRAMHRETTFTGDVRFGAPYWRVLAAVTAFGLVNFSDALLLLRAHELGLSVGAVIGVYVLYNLSYAALSYPAGAVSDRLPRHRVFALGIAVFAVAYVGLGAVTTGAWVWLLLPVYGAYTALTDGVGKAWVSTLVDDAHTGRALGVFHGATGGATLVAGVWAGLAWGDGGRVPLVVAGAVAAVVALALGTAGGRLAGPRVAAAAR